jgi:hypothetical protein
VIGVVGMGNKKETAKNRAQFNTVFPTQKEVDRVGFEPTTSAMQNVGDKTILN